MTFKNPGEPAKEGIRAKPLPGQGLPDSTRVSLRRDFREGKPIGTFLLIRAKITSREGGKRYLYSPPSSKPEVITKKKAEEFVSEEFGSNKD